MVSYYYPPLNDVGILRTIGFSGHLPDFGWQPIILTVKNPDLHRCHLDPKQTSPRQIVYRSRSIVNYSRFAGRLNGLISKIVKFGGVNLEYPLIPDLFMVPDFACGWIPLTILKGLRLIRAHKIDVIFATCNPYSAAIVGAVLSQLSGKRLIIDLRDPWREDIVQRMVGNRSGDPIHMGDRLKDFMDRILETKTLHQASRIILVTEETLQVYSKLYPTLRDRFEVIHNGYGDGFFTGEPRKRFDAFTIVYSGSYYYSADKSEAFFQALANIKNKGVQNGNIRFLYIGKSGIVSKMIEKYGLQQITDSPGYVGRKEAIDLMGRASVILLRNVKPHLTTKLFEGLASGVPFLALTGEGEAANLIRQYSKSSIILEGSNPGEIENGIRTLYGQWVEGKLSYQVNHEFENSFSKYKLTEKLATILDRLPDSHSMETGLNA